MPPEEWGPPIWTLFHCLAEKMRPESFSQIGRPLFVFIYKICSFLPCPECSHHAKTFLGKIHPSSLHTKDDLKNVLFLFHNAVNKRKNKPMMTFDQLTTLYANKNTTHALKQFLSVYHTKGNMNMINDSFHRQMVLNSFYKWIMNQRIHFSN